MSVLSVVTTLSQALGEIAPLVDIANPVVGSILTTLGKVMTDASVAVPAAVAIVDQIKAGTPVTLTQLGEYDSTFDADAAQLELDIAAQKALNDKS